jgi:hypothetical protein
MHLLVAITSHGFGHAAQVAPVVNALRRQRDAFRLTVLSSLPVDFLHSRIEGDFDLVAEAPDFGLIMNSALAIDLDASAAAYRQLHAGWQALLDREAERLLRIAPDLVVADVPYVTLAAAAQAGIPALALCSLNWADIYRHYFGRLPEGQEIVAQMESAYNSARAFLCPEPSMPMSFLTNRVDIGPIATVATAQRDRLGRQLGVDAGDLVVLVAPGGVATRFPVEDWPAGQGIHWLVSERWQVRHPDVSHYETTGFGFTELIASCDAVLGKCGYGTVTECVANGTPLMYIPRPDWPEEETLLRWLEAHGAALPVDSQRLVTGDFADLIAPLRAMRVAPCRPIGADDAAAWIDRHF